MFPASYGETGAHCRTSPQRLPQVTPEDIRAALASPVRLVEWYPNPKPAQLYQVRSTGLYSCMI